MEDYSPSPDEVENTPLKRRRFLPGNFLRSWLEHRRADGSEADKSDDDEPDEKVEKKSWLPERVLSHWGVRDRRVSGAISAGRELLSGH